jgi:hypothetical protein
VDHPERFPGDGYVQLKLGDYVENLTMDLLLRNAFNDNFKTLFASFKNLIGQWVAAHGSARPKLLDIRGRARSGSELDGDPPVRSDFLTVTANGSNPHQSLSR